MSDPAHRPKKTSSFRALGPGHTVHRTNVTIQKDTFLELPDHTLERLQHNGLA